MTAVRKDDNCYLGKGLLQPGNVVRFRVFPGDHQVRHLSLADGGHRGIDITRQIGSRLRQDLLPVSEHDLLARIRRGANQVLTTLGKQFGVETLCNHGPDRCKRRAPELIRHAVQHLRKREGKQGLINVDYPGVGNRAA